MGGWAGGWARQLADCGIGGVTVSVPKGGSPPFGEKADCRQYRQLQSTCGRMMCVCIYIYIHIYIYIYIHMSCVFLSKYIHVSSCKYE